MLTAWPMCTYFYQISLPRMEIVPIIFYYDNGMK